MIILCVVSLDINSKHYFPRASDRYSIAFLKMCTYAYIKKIWRATNELNSQLNILHTIPWCCVRWLHHVLQQPDDHYTCSTCHLQTGDYHAADHAATGKMLSTRTSSRLIWCWRIFWYWQNRESWRDKVSRLDSTPSWHEI